MAVAWRPQVSDLTFPQVKIWEAHFQGPWICSPHKVGEPQASFPEGNLRSWGMGWALPNTMCKAVTGHLFPPLFILNCPHPQIYFGWCWCLASPCGPYLHSWGGGSESLWSYPFEARAAALKWRCLGGISWSCADGLSHPSASVVTPHLWSLGTRCTGSLAAAIPVALCTMYIVSCRAMTLRGASRRPKSVFRMGVCGSTSEPSGATPTCWSSPGGQALNPCRVISPSGPPACRRCPGQPGCTGFSGQSRNFLHGQQQRCCLVNYCTITWWRRIDIKTKLWQNKVICII